MKKKLVVATLLALVLMLCAGSAMAAKGYCFYCGFDREGQWDYYDGEIQHYFFCFACEYTTVSTHSFEANAADEYLDSDATCTSPAKYVKSCLCGDRSSETFEYGEPLGHEFKDYQYDENATCTEDGTETAKCVRYGKDGCEATDTRTKAGTKLGHDYKLTSTKNGDKNYTCSNCGDTYTEKHTHWYGEWTGTDDGAQTANCKIDGCKYTGKVACKIFEYTLITTLNDALSKETFTFCPVCGTISRGERLELVEEAKAEADTLPKGELVLRRNAEFMSIGFEYAGKLTKPTKPVNITLPAESLDGYTLTILDADGTETALETTADGEIVQFTIDFGEEKVVLIHLTTAE